MPSIGPLERFLSAIDRAEDAYFERRYGLNLSAAAGEAEPVSCATLRRAVAEAQRTRIPFDTFVDLGTGTGKACFVVAQKMRLPRIIGVEVSPARLAIAQSNRLIFGATNVRFEQADPASFALPAGTPLVLLDTPLVEAEVRSFVATNAERLRGSRALIAYANDTHRAALLESGFTTLRRFAERGLSLYRPPS